MHGKDQPGHFGGDWSSYALARDLTKALGVNTRDCSMQEEIKKQINSVRFSWHEQVLRDAEVRKRPTALSFAGHVMHRFDPVVGCAQISLKAASIALGMDKTSVIRARDFLLERGWVRRLETAFTHSGEKLPARYILSGGPDDLAMELHAGSTIEPPEAPQLLFSSAEKSKSQKTRLQP